MSTNCFLCGNTFGMFETPTYLNPGRRDYQICAECASVINAVKQNHGKDHAICKTAYEKNAKTLQGMVYKAGLNQSAQDAIDRALGFSFLAKAKEDAAAEVAEEAEYQKATASMLITSGFNFEGYRITKYSGYISGDDVVQVARGTNFLIGGGTDTGSALSDALVKIRRNALRELKRAAYDLGCNAVIGVDFDYITLEPETANITGGTTYMPYVFCVTANGNAVVIEKIED